MSSTALFLDGPLAGQMRGFAEDTPTEVLHVERYDDPFGPSPRRYRETYRRKPGVAAGTPDWVYALQGSRAGDVLESVYSLGDEALGDEAKTAKCAELACLSIRKLCDSLGLVAADVHEAVREPVPGQRGMTRFVWRAVAMPPDWRDWI